MELIETVDSVHTRNPIYVVRSDNYRSVVLGVKDSEIVARKYFMADTQLEARHAASGYVEGWNKRHGKEESNPKG